MPEQKPDHLIVRYLSNEATPAEQEQLFEWVSQNKENQKVFNEYVNLWSLHDKPADQYGLEKGLHRLNQRIDAFEANGKKRINFWNPWNIAAAVMLLVVSGFMLFRNEPIFSLKHKETLLTATSVGRVSTLVLADGSRITLNRDASLEYPASFETGKREVYLTGEAFFEVTKDSLKPFIIHANGITTTVLGTSFNVNAAGETVVVTVATGKVQVTDGRQSEILKPNEKLMCRNIFRKEPSDLSELEWNARVLEFDDTDLSRAAEMISHYYDIQVIFENQALKKCLITGKFKNQKLEAVLNAIEFSTDVRYEVRDNVVSLSGKGCQ